MYLYGASGHGKVIKEILEAQSISIDAFVDDDQGISQLCGIPILHYCEGLTPMIVSIGINRTRKKIVEKLSCQFMTAIHPTAIVSPSAIIGEGTVVMPGAIINADAVIGKHCIVNTGASIDHECVIGDYCHIAPHVTLCGQVHVGEGTLIGAGAAVVEDVLDNATVVGVPAKLLKIRDLSTLTKVVVGGNLLIIKMLQKPQAERSCHAA